MSRGLGTNPFHVAAHEAVQGVIPLQIHQQTVAATGSYSLFAGSAPFALRVIGFRGIMTGAGAGGDTIALHDKSSNVIATAVDVSAKADKEVWAASLIDDARWDIEKGGDLLVVTVSGALAYCIVDFIRR